ncbi:PGF-CTERM sorting domain-containing protein [Halogeometricum limi]|uniref:PGF-CTERM protein n=1 Tax=Halogeometricum limi TaxID=555875 RepID=A0A1I6GID9_9EURY|nr:PGF-CTERM sorting domain-containing protein [Halogeometricum limi]SFR41901.1 PGF-CTERM protein [Halogeometricum limi]
MHSKTLALSLVVLLSTSLVAGVAVADAEATLEIRPSGSGTATYAATVGVDNESVGPLSAFEMHLGEAGVTPASVPPSAVVTAGIDRGGDDSGTAVDVDVRDDISGVSVDEDGVVEVFFDGTTQLEAGDELVVVVEGLPTPAAGTDAVPLGVNAPGERALVNATVAVSDSAAGATATPEADGPDPTETDGADAIDVTNSPVPGFGGPVALAALLAVTAFLARAARR